MKHPIMITRMAALACGALISFAACDFAAAQGKVDIGKVTFDDLPSPNLQIGKNKAFKPKDWLEFEASLEVPPFNKEMEKIGFVDQIVVKWSVALQNPDGRGFILIQKDITHINVPLNEEVYSSVYFSPNTLKRLTGKDRAGKSSVDRVMCEVLVNGRVMGAASSKGNPDWVQKGAGSLSNQSSRFPLLNKNETPFRSYWWDRYAEIQPER